MFNHYNITVNTFIIDQECLNLISRTIRDYGKEINQVLKEVATIACVVALVQGCYAGRVSLIN